MTHEWKQALKSRYERYLINAIEDSTFFAVYMQRPYSLSRSLCVGNEGLTLSTGATRGCLLAPHSDYVVKFDIEGCAAFDSGCEVELNVYADARAQGFSRYLCEPIALGAFTYTTTTYDFDEALDVLGLEYLDEHSYFDDQDIAALETYGTRIPVTYSIPLYAYKKEEPLTYQGFSPEQLETANSYVSPLNERNLDVAARFIQDYGLEEFERFSDFLAEEGITDLHDGNVYEENGKMVLIDYAGYADSAEFEVELASSDFILDVSRTYPPYWDKRKR